MKESITQKEKALLDFMYEKANDIIDYCHRNGILLPVSISVHPDFSASGPTYDYRDVSFAEYYDSGHTKRIVSLGYNAYEDNAEYHESLYEDKEDE